MFAISPDFLNNRIFIPLHLVILTNEQRICQGRRPGRGPDGATRSAFAGDKIVLKRPKGDRVFEIMNIAYSI